MPGNRQIGVVESDRKPTESTLIDSAKARFSGLITGNFGTHSDLVRLLLGEAGYLAGRLNGFLKPELQQIRGLVLVYVCLGDINRSPFAENLSISMRLHAASIGLSASSGAPAFDTAAFRHRSFTGCERTEGDLLRAMEIRHAHRLPELGVPEKAIALFGRWATLHCIHNHDPRSLSGAYFCACFTIILSAVRESALACCNVETHKPGKFVCVTLQ